MSNQQYQCRIIGYWVADIIGD